MVIERRRGFSYEKYVEKQGNKIHNPEKREQLLRRTEHRQRTFQRVFTRIKDHLRSGRVLCLGARTGCEIIGARRAGFKDSQGIDLHPVGDLTIQGDWHDIPFENSSFENVFTNSIDHCYDLQKMIHEIRRVLKPKGRVCLLLSRKQMLHNKKDKEKYMRGSQNFLFWEDALDLASVFQEQGFQLVFHERLRTNWACVILEKM